MIQVVKYELFNVTKLYVPGLGILLKRLLSLPRRFRKMSMAVTITFFLKIVSFIPLASTTQIERGITLALHKINLKFR